MNKTITQPCIYIDCASKPCHFQLIGFEDKYGKSLSPLYIALNHDQKAEDLIFILSKTLDSYNVQRDSALKIIVNKGPGIFTGIRVGLSTAKGLSLGFNAQLIGLSQFQLLYLALLHKEDEALNAQSLYGFITPAKGESFYITLYSKGQKQQNVAYEISVPELEVLCKDRPEISLITADKNIKDIIPQTHAAFKRVKYIKLDEIMVDLLNSYDRLKQCNGDLSDLSANALYIRSANAALPHPLLKLA